MSDQVDPTIYWINEPPPELPFPDPRSEEEDWENEEFLRERYPDWQ